MLRVFYIIYSKVMLILGCYNFLLSRRITFDNYIFFEADLLSWKLHRDERLPFGFGFGSPRPLLLGRRGLPELLVDFDFLILIWRRGVSNQI